MTTFQLNKTSSLSGKTAIVTGANIGLGFETTLALAKKECQVIMACRNLDKAKIAKSKMLKKIPNAKITIEQLDLNSLNSVKDFAEKFNQTNENLDLLINNAGIMMPPYQKTAEGFESQFGVNYLSHFLLTGLLFDKLKNTSSSRVVSLSSLAHKWGDIYFDDPHFETKYNAKKAYGQSKVACLMFGYELDRRIKKQELDMFSTIAHPGLSNTNLAQHMPKAAVAMAQIVSPLFLQSPEKGALPTLRAALDPRVKGGEYFGPDGFREHKGNPIKIGSNSYSKNEENSQRLWTLSEELTNFKFSVE